MLQMAKALTPSSSVSLQLRPALLQLTTVAVTRPCNISDAMLGWVAIHQLQPNARCSPRMHSKVICGKRTSRSGSCTLIVAPAPNMLSHYLHRVHSGCRLA